MIAKISAAISVAILLFGAGVAMRQHLLNEFGEALMDENYAVAAEKLHWLAEFGDATAQYHLGNLYAFGLGVPKNEIRAKDMFRRSAMWAEGDMDPSAPAMYYVGEKYLEGHGGVARNVDEARKWIKHSAQGGYPLAISKLAEMNAVDHPRKPR